MTAIEWLLNEISSTTILDKEDIKLFEQAKELENQQQGYSEEEVIDIAIKYFNHYYNISSRGRLLIDHDLEWFEQFKNK